MVLYGSVYALEAGRWKLDAGSWKLDAGAGSWKVPAGLYLGPRGRVLYVCSARLGVVWSVGVSWLSS